MKNTLGLNVKQKQFVFSKSKKILLIACAGSGKTLVITRKVGQLIDERVSPESIYCISFTRAAAMELKTRLIKLNKLGKDINATTFHSFIICFMKKYCNSNFSMITDSEKDIVLNNICQRFKIKSIKKFKEAYKTSLINDDKSIQYAINEYIFRLNYLNLMDIDILLPLFLKKIKEDSILLDNIRQDIEYLFYDEAQDMNNLQYQILTTIIPPESDKGFALIGDDDQNLYQWNNTDVKYILDFPEKYGAEVFILDENYRCSNQIIKASNAIISKNTKRFDKSVSGFFDKDLLNLCSFETEQEEIIRLVGLAFSYKHNKEKTLAILCRTNKEIERINKVFKSMNIDSNTSIKEILNSSNIEFLKLVVNPANDLLVEKVIGISKENKIKALEEEKSFFEILLEEKNGLALKVSMFNCMARTQKAMQIYNTISSNLNIEDIQLENAIKCWTSKLKSSKANSLNDFLNYIETKDAQENLKDGTSNINITTIHGAKGLEFDEVVLFNFDNFNFSSQGDVEETRRLLYVAFTRAKEKLNLYFSKKNFYKQKECSCTVSPFLKELPGNDVWFEDYFKE